MSAPAWTPGPWHYAPDATVVDCAYRGLVALGDDEDSGPTAEDCANARLIAAAPDLYAALEALTDYLIPGDDDRFGYELLDRAQAALAAARGSS